MLRRTGWGLPTRDSLTPFPYMSPQCFVCCCCCSFFEVCKMGPRALPTQGMRLTRATCPSPQAQTLCCCLARTSDTQPPIKGLGCRKNTSLLQLLFAFGWHLSRYNHCWNRWIGGIGGPGSNRFLEFLPKKLRQGKKDLPIVPYR